MATVIDYFSLLVTAWSSTIYLSLPGACPRWKERASSRSRKHMFHPDEFLRSQVTGQRSTCMRLPFPSQMYAHTHTHTQTQLTVSIDILDIRLGSLDTSLHELCHHAQFLPSLRSHSKCSLATSCVCVCVCACVRVA